MKIHIEGKEIFDKKDFHKQLGKALGVEQYYGQNLDALWDLLGFGVERPLTLYWTDAELSKQRLGNDFDNIIQILQQVKTHDDQLNWQDRFDFVLQ